MKRLRIILIALTGLTPGCVNALHQGSSATDVKLSIQTAQPERYSVHVALESPGDYPVPADGCVTFTVPPFRNGCDVYLFGGIKVRDGAAENVRVIEIRWNGRVVRRLSLSQIARLTHDEAGYSTIKVGD